MNKDEKTTLSNSELGLRILEMERDARIKNMEIYALYVPDLELSIDKDSPFKTPIITKFYGIVVANKRHLLKNKLILDIEKD